jgi:hypothetical protein
MLEKNTDNYEGILIYNSEICNLNTIITLSHDNL